MARALLKNSNFFLAYQTQGTGTLRAQHTRRGEPDAGAETAGRRTAAQRRQAGDHYSQLTKSRRGETDGLSHQRQCIKDKIINKQYGPAASPQDNKELNKMKREVKRTKKSILFLPGKILEALKAGNTISGKIDGIVFRTRNQKTHIYSREEK